MCGIPNVMGWQLELADESGKTPKANVHDVKIIYLEDELIKCLHDEKALDVQLNTMHIQN